MTEDLNQRNTKMSFVGHHKRQPENNSSARSIAELSSTSLSFGWNSGVSCSESTNLPDHGTSLPPSSYVGADPTTMKRSSSALAATILEKENETNRQHQHLVRLPPTQSTPAHVDNESSISFTRTSPLMTQPKTRGLYQQTLYPASSSSFSSVNAASFHNNSNYQKSNRNPTVRNLASSSISATSNNCIPKSPCLRKSPQTKHRHPAFNGNGSNSSSSSSSTSGAMSVSSSKQQRERAKGNSNHSADDDKQKSSPTALNSTTAIGPLQHRHHQNYRQLQLPQQQQQTDVELLDHGMDALNLSPVGGRNLHYREFETYSSGTTVLNTSLSNYSVTSDNSLLGLSISEVSIRKDCINPVATMFLNSSMMNDDDDDIEMNDFEDRFRTIVTQQQEEDQQQQQQQQFHHHLRQQQQQNSNKDDSHDNSGSDAGVVAQHKYIETYQKKDDSYYYLPEMDHQYYHPAAILRYQQDDELSAPVSIVRTHPPPTTRASASLSSSTLTSAFVMPGGGEGVANGGVTSPARYTPSPPPQLLYHPQPPLQPLHQGDETTKSTIITRPRPVRPIPPSLLPSSFPSLRTATTNPTNTTSTWSSSTSSSLLLPPLSMSLSLSSSNDSGSPMRSSTSASCL